MNALLKHQLENAAKDAEARNLVPMADILRDAIYAITCLELDNKRLNEQYNAAIRSAF